MVEYFKVLQDCVLFEGVEEEALKKVLLCLKGRQRKYPKDGVLLGADEPVSAVGIVLEGAVQVAKIDAQGNQSILTQVGVGELFAETFACAGIEKSPVIVSALTESVVLFVDYRKIITTCTTTCQFHLKLIENMLKLLATKNLLLNQKIDFISKRTIRDKLLTYFETQQVRANSKSFRIPFSRYQLADYLCVDRSAMSRELGKMKKEGLLQFRGNLFELQ